MDKPYSRELSADSTFVIIPSIAIPELVVGLIAATFYGARTEESWHYWVLVVVAPILAYAAWLLVKNDRLETGVQNICHWQFTIIDLNFESRMAAWQRRTICVCCVHPCFQHDRTASLDL